MCVPFAFLSGGLLSGLAGFIVMAVATNSSSRTANAAKGSLNLGLRVAFSSGAVTGLVVVGCGLFHLSGWYYFLDWYYGVNPLPTGMSKVAAITSTLLCSGMGASFVALFARVGGGIFTKTADISADLVGKVELGIPEDDPRNPAVIADNVGDNVGDVAGMGADLFDSYVASIIAVMILGQVIGKIDFPLVFAAFGILSSILGALTVRVGKKGNPGKALNRGTYFTCIFFSLIIDVNVEYESFFKGI